MRRYGRVKREWMRQIVTVPLLLALSACSDAKGTPGGGDAGAASAVAGNAGATSSSGGSPSVGGSTGAAGSGQGGSSAGTSAGTNTGGNGTAGVGGNDGGSVTPLELEPLAVGNLWTYTVTVQEPTDDCPNGSGTREIKTSVEWEGRTAFEMHRFCDLDPTYLNVTNGEIYQYLEGWYRNVAAPVQEGATWAFAPGYTLKWSSVGAVTVPAGTFTNCWRRSIAEYEGSITFCPGVGQVQIELPPRLTAELSAYHLN